jgi:hypothetical protein
MLQLTTIFFLITFFVLALLHNIAIKLYLYWQISWFDIPMHAFGGAVVALGIFTLRDLGIIPNKFIKLIPVICGVMLVALVWEMFELMVGFPRLADYYIDTITDLSMGALGAIVGYYVGNSLRNLR